MMKKRKTPSSYVIVLCIITLIAVLTHFIEGVTPAYLYNIFTAPVEGFKKSVSVILFIIVNGGFLKIVSETRILDAGIAGVVKKAKGKEVFIIPILLFVFSLGGTSFGMAEETLPFYPLVITTMLACGYDVMTGAAIILLGMFCGVSGSTVNPFAIGVAVEALGTSTGIICNQAQIMAVNTVIWLSSVSISSIYLMKYAKKVQKNKRNSIMSAAEQEMAEAKFSHIDVDADTAFTAKMKVILGLFAAAYILMVLALIPWQNYNITVFQGWTAVLTGNSFGAWGANDLSVWFIVMAVVIGMVHGMSEKAFIRTFIKGGSELVGTALIVGCSKGISIIMAETGFDLFLLNAGKDLLGGVSSGLFESVSYLVYTGLTVLIPSTSGLASASIPTFGALANSLGLSPEVMICTYIGCHFVVGMTPTAGIVMSGLDIAKIEFPTWVRFYIKLYAMISVVNIAVLSVFMTLL